MARTRQTCAVALTLAILASSCAGALPQPPPRPGACDPSHLAACEEALGRTVASGEHVTRASVAAWIEARRAREAADGWVAAWDGLVQRATAEREIVVVLHPRGAPAPVGPRAVDVKALPAPEGATTEAMLAALASAANLEELVNIDGEGATIAFGDDPLAPFVPEVEPAIRTRAATLVADLAMADGVRDAIGAANRGDFGGVASAARALVRQTSAPAGEDSLARAALAIATLDGAGIAPKGIHAPASRGGDAPTTAYAAFARVATGRLASSAIAAKDHPALDAAVGLGATCGAVPVPSKIDHLHALASLPHVAGFAALAGRGDVARAAAWADRYAEAVATVRRAKVGWAYGALLVRFAGELGVGPESAAAVDASAMAATHAKALGALPVVTSSSPAIAALVGASPFGRADLQAASAELVKTQARAPLGSANGATELLLAAAGAVFGSAGYPPALRAAALDAVDVAFTARLHHDMTGATGWRVAALYAADVAARAAGGRKADVSFAAEQIARALSANGVDEPQLAALAAVAARYAALAADGLLDVEHRDPRRMPKRRVEAREALHLSIERLGGDAPKNVVDDVTELGDGLFAALASARAHAAAAPPTTPKAVCAGDEARGLDAGTRRALARLGDVRQRILSHPRFRSGDGEWVKRVRGLVLVLSDTMDFILRDTATGPARKSSGLTIPADQARAFAEGVLNARLLGPTPDARVLADAYVIARAVAVDRDRAKAPHPTAGEATRLMKEFLDLVGAGASGESASLLRLLRGAGIDAASPSALVEQLHAALAAANRSDDADAALLLALVVEAVSDVPPSRTLVDAALARKSRVAWALALVAEMDAARGGAAPDPERFRAALREATANACSVSTGADAVVDVARALADASAGRLAEAAARLDARLDLAERDGLALPRVAFRYAARGERAALGLTISVSSGLGLLRGSPEFHLDAGVTTAERGGRALTAALAGTNDGTARDEAGRFFVGMAARAASYHFLAGHEAAAARAAARVTGAVLHGVRLGAEGIPAPAGFAWARDARGAIAVAAELAGEHDMPLLSGDLFTLVARSAAPDADARALDVVLAEAPLGLASPAFAPSIDRARRALVVLAHALPCGRHGDAPGLEEVTCQEYARAIALREADAVKHLPRLARKARGGATCDAFRALDGFLASADQKTYEADALAAAATAFAEAERPYEAAVLLARYKRRGHCSGPVVGLDRALGRSSALGPDLAADVLSDALNCEAASNGAAVGEDLLALDAMTLRLADPSRNLHLLLSVADRAAHDGSFDALGRLARQPSFVDRWIGANATAATAALLVRHAVATIDPKTQRFELTDADRLLCDGAPPERAELCRSIHALTAPTADASTARDALRAIAASGRP